MTIALAHDLCRGSASEAQSLEFKVVATQCDTRKLCRCCVAIASECRGHLVPGIASAIMALMR